MQQQCDSDGSPIEVNRVNSKQPKMLPYDEWERKRDSRGTAHRDVPDPDTTFMASKPDRNTSTKTQRPSTAESSKPKATLEVFERTNDLGQKVLATEERDLHLHNAEKVDPSGKYVQSKCPTPTGRPRGDTGLSRSKAIKLPVSPIREKHMIDKAGPTKAKPSPGGRSRALTRSNAIHKNGAPVMCKDCDHWADRQLTTSQKIRSDKPVLCDNPDHWRDRVVKLQRPSEGLTGEKSRKVGLGSDRYTRSPRPSSSHVSGSIHRGMSKVNNIPPVLKSGPKLNNIPPASKPGPKLRRSKFQENLRDL